MLDRGYLGDPSPRSVYKALTGSQDTEQNRKIFPFAYFHANFNYQKTAQKMLSEPCLSTAQVSNVLNACMHVKLAKFISELFRIRNRLEGDRKSLQWVCKL